MSDSVLQCQSLGKIFKDAGKPVEVFTDINLAVAAGESVAIVGRSGSGKSTLLHLLGGLDKPTTGTVNIAGQCLTKLNEQQRSMLRNKTLGFIYQFHHLLPEFTALENVCMPLLMSKIMLDEAQKRASDILDQVGLANRIEHKVSQLSGGERQRVAIARALVTQPACVLADEPTGNLDSHTADSVFELMLQLKQQMKTSLIIVTHDQSLAKRMDKMYVLEDGCLSLA